MLAELHLVRHGEVLNPDGVVYADLAGFGLSEIGRSQAAAAADHLRTLDAAALWSSPLDRATETAQEIANGRAIETVTDDRLTEWALGVRWAGVRWDDLPALFPGELERYLEDPAGLDVADETISDVADRMEAAIMALSDRFSGASAVVVSHQDPIQALRLRLTGRPLSDLQRDKPGHACVISLRPDRSGWHEERMWCPKLASAPFPPVETPDET